jgi:3-keto-5-aminohexanoate cleavage enzyme
LTQTCRSSEKWLAEFRGETDAVLCLTTSGILGRNLSTEERLQSLVLKPNCPRCGPINIGEHVFLNPTEFLDELAKKTLALGIKPELEVFDVGMIYTSLRYFGKGLLKPPLHFQFVLGTPAGSPATVKSLLHFSEIVPQGSTWSDRNRCRTASMAT